MNQFEIPVVVFFFKRVDKTAEVLKRISEVRPRKIYLISDGPRSDTEAEAVEQCRKRVEELITWPCEVVRNYAIENKGVFDRIGLGAQWVLSQEDSAIFLEDDNLPEVTFFKFCAEMLHYYKDDCRVLWVCGTNYLSEYEPVDGSSYMFTRHLLPCGWASWGHKFGRYYQGDLRLVDESGLVKRVLLENPCRPLARQDMRNWLRERKRILKSMRPNSWDYQMSFTLRAHGLYGVVPKYNQIKNIGVDIHSTHGGTTMSNLMTRRFCEIETKPMGFPLVHPKLVMTDILFERKIGNIILLPLRYRFKGFLVMLAKIVFRVPDDLSLSGEIKARFKRMFG